MEDPFFTADLDRLLDDFEEKEAPAALKKSVKKNKKDSYTPANYVSSPINNTSSHPATTTGECSVESNVPVDLSFDVVKPVTADAVPEMLIDFSAPTVPVVTTHKVPDETMKDLDFLLSVIPQGSNSSNTDVNLVASQNGDLSDKSLNAVTPEINQSAAIAPKETLGNNCVNASSSNASVGFTDDIKVDDDEFHNFMQESDNSTSGGYSSSQSSISKHNVMDLLTSKPSNVISWDEKVDSPHMPEAAQEEKALPIQNIPHSGSSSETSGSTVSTPNTLIRPKLKKIFHKDLGGSSSSTSVVKGDANTSSVASVQQSCQAMMANKDIVKQAAVALSNSNTSNFTESQAPATLHNSDVLDTSAPYNEPVNCMSASTASVEHAPARHVARPSSLGVNVQQHEVTTVPSVSPPSYSSVIAGDYSAGTMIQENPVRQYPTAVPVQGMQPTLHSRTEVSSELTREALIECGVEITEDGTQNHLEDAMNRAAPPILPVTISRPGMTKPHWVPDEDSPTCTKCKAKFTFTKRRHHCRACGRVFCSACCSERSKLVYLNYAEARVCILCYTSIVQADAMAGNALMQGIPNQQHAVPPPIAPASHSSVNAPRPVLKNDDGAASAVPKSVTFFDGTKPDRPTVAPATPPLPSRASRTNRASQRTGNGDGRPTLFPPVIVGFDETGSNIVEEGPDPVAVLTLLKTNENHFVTFMLSSNLYVFLKRMHYEGILCYYFISVGLDSVGQSEVAFLLQVGSSDESIPYHAFSLYSHLFNIARKGKAILSNEYLALKDFLNPTELMFGSDDYAGLLFARRTCQNIESLPVETTDSAMFSPTVQFSSTLFALLVRKSEVAWANLFPSRLLLGLGAKYKKFPYPLLNINERPAVYGEVANTILGILCDLRNYKYRVVTIPGISVVIKENGVTVNIPYNRFTDVLKTMNSSNEHVLALGADTYIADENCTSHLACIQNTSNSIYHTEVLLKSGSQVDDDSSLKTGAAFVVFNGSLKSGTTQQAKCAVVEDGVMVQLLPEKMSVLKEALKAMEDFRLNCFLHHNQNESGNAEKQQSTTDVLSNQQFIEVCWVRDDTKFNIGLSSPIDFRSFEGVVGYNVQGKSEKKGKGRVLRWNQVFFFRSTSDILDMSRLAEKVANGCFHSLVAHMKSLRDSSQTKIGVRVSIHPDDVGYAVGSGGLPLPDPCLTSLDDNLVPIIHEASASLHGEDEPVVFEVLFSVLEIRSGWKSNKT